MTLVLIVVAALSQVGIARRSLQLALEAKEAQRELQHRWGAKSCRELLLDAAPQVLEGVQESHLDAGGVYPVPSALGAEFSLGGMRCRAWLASEDAKLNLNTLHDELPDRSLALVGQLIGNQLPYRLLPDTRPEAAERESWYTSLAQVFELTPVFQDGRLDALVAATAGITCWGDGKLDINTVGDESLEAVISALISSKTAGDLIEARRVAVNLDLKDLLDGLDIRRAQKAKLRRWLTDESSCHSLWLEMAGPQRSWYHLWVDGHGTGAATANPLHFRW